MIRPFSTGPSIVMSLLGSSSTCKALEDRIPAIVQHASNKRTRSMNARIVWGRAWCAKNVVSLHMLCTRYIESAYEHRFLPLLVINMFLQIWRDGSYQRITLQELGLIVQLGHRPGEVCCAPVWAPRGFVIIHINGFHPVNLCFCGCDNVSTAGSRVEQLLRSEFFPATLVDPTTCATFRVLELFHILTLQSKLNAYDFYQSLGRLTDSAGIGKQFVSVVYPLRGTGTDFCRVTKERIKSFLRMVREWRHIKMLMRAGRGHDPTGVSGTSQGELCLRCPACPKPGINIPDNWHTVSDDLK